MTLFLILLALILVTGVVWTLVVIARDGYRRLPERRPGGSGPRTWA
jgi:hypothetical protein